MGLTLGWIAIEGDEEAAVLSRLGLEPVGDSSDPIGQDFACAKTSKGWFLLAMAEPPTQLDEMAKTACPVGFCLSGFMSEPVMMCELRAYRDGAPIWSLARDPSRREEFAMNKDVLALVDEPLRRRRQEQAAAENAGIDVFFDLPLEICAKLSGYWPGQGSLKWTVLRFKTRTKAAPSRRPRSLSDAIRSELLPLLWSLGWVQDPCKSNLSEQGEITRALGRQEQAIWFEFTSGRETYIEVCFWTQERLESGFDRIVFGHTRNPPVRIPLWKRFSWRYLWDLTHPAPEIEGPIEAAIDRARAEILAVDEFLRTGTCAPCIYVDRAFSREPPPL